MPITAVMVKSKYCDNIGYGCAKQQDHMIITIDKDTENLLSGSVIKGLQIFEKHINESYKVLYVRCSEMPSYSEIDFKFLQRVTMTPMEIRVVDVKKMMDSGKEILLLDVRSSKEWSESIVKLPGSIRIHITEINSYMGKIPKNVPVITYCTCRHEKLSVRVTQILIENGFNNSHFLMGGFDAWVSAGYPLETK
jgi:rhodanese-related sulfurtransferase